jgi:hypothetical protein
MAERGKIGLKDGATEEEACASPESFNCGAMEFAGDDRECDRDGLDPILANTLWYA